MSTKEIKWSAADQRELDALTKRKALFEDQRMGALLSVVAKLDFMSEFQVHPERLASAMRLHADDLRDALAPFDSGIRCATQEQT